MKHTTEELKKFDKIVLINRIQQLEKLLSKDTDVTMEEVLGQEPFRKDTDTEILDWADENIDDFDYLILEEMSRSDEDGILGRTYRRRSIRDLITKAKGEL